MKSLEFFLSVVENSLIRSMILSVIRGTTTAEIWSDELKAQSLNHNEISVLIHLPPKIWIFLGNPHNLAFNRRCRTIFEEKIPLLKPISNGYYKIFCDDEDWIDFIQNDILHEITNPILDKRICYTLKFPSNILSNPNIAPSNIEFAVVNSTNLLKLREFENWNWIEEEIGENWKNLTHFLENNGIGVVAYVAGKQLVGWILSEFQSPTSLGIGIEVSPKYRKKGIASRLGYLFLDQVRKFQKKVNHRVLVFWDAWHFNVASHKVAQKIGFSNSLKFNILYGFWNEFNHILEQSYYWRDRLKYLKAAECVDNAIRSSGVEISYKIYYLAACNYALANNSSEAFKFLKMSLNSCLENKDDFKKHIISDEDFQHLTHHPEFQAIIDLS